MINLENTTFIIPLKIDCEDRKNNLFLNLNYLNFHFKTNVIIYEKGNFIYENKDEIIKKYNNLKLEFLFDKNENEKIFHRTKYLNRMLDIVKTPVVCNYDIDVVFDEDVYKKCETLILQNEFDMIYPYGKGYFQIEDVIYKNVDLIKSWINYTINKKDIAVLHVRLGDFYFKDSRHLIISQEYYINCIEKFASNYNDIIIICDSLKETWEKIYINNLKEKIIRLGKNPIYNEKSFTVKKNYY